ncbi:thiolase family protein [Candidatus Nitrosopelagicus sp.]|nr:thiolase family protein [Candidatus Nitrosopelagicus sp.]
MKKVGIAGYGSTKFSKNKIPIEELLVESTKQVFQTTSNLSQNLIDGVIVSTNDNSKYLGAIVSERSGIKPKISHTIEHLCSSGTNAVISAFSYIASGLADVILVTGGDVIGNPGQVLEWDQSRGELNHPIYWGSIFTKAYKRKFNTTEEELAIVSAKNHKQAIDNPNSYSHEPYTISQIMNSKIITDDLRILDCSYPCSGSASVLLASENIIKKFTDTPIWISGIGQKTNSASFTKNDLLNLSSTISASNDAYAMSNTNSNDIDVAEVHDAFSVCELMAVKDLGLTEKSSSTEFIRNLFNTGDRKINPRGGLIGAGHPLGATGISQIIEITQQLQNNAEKRQIPNVKKGLVHNMSAAATSSTVLILES